MKTRYQKPMLEKVKLAPAEAVLQACKTNRIVIIDESNGNAAANSACISAGVPGYVYGS